MLEGETGGMVRVRRRMSTAAVAVLLTLLPTLPVLVVALPAAPAAAVRTVPATWVSTWSTRVARTAQVDRVVSISRTVLTRDARARGATVSYRWYVGTRRTAATGLRFRVPRSAYGRVVRARVTVTRARMAPRSVVVGFGRARGTPQDAAKVRLARQQVLAAINAVRAEHDLPAVRAQSAMTSVAQRWSVRMASTLSLRHNPAFARQIPTGWSSAAENVAMGAPPGTVTGWWMGSPPHRANLLGRFDRVGIGVAVDDRGLYWFVLDLARY